MADEPVANPIVDQIYPLLDRNHTMPAARPSSNTSVGLNNKTAEAIPQPATASPVIAPASKLSLWRKFKPSTSWFLKAKSKEPTDTDQLMWTDSPEDDNVSDAVTPPATSPDYESTKLLRLLENHRPIAEILREGGVEKLKEEGISLDDFYQHGYALRDIHVIFPGFDDLLDFGFTKHHLFGTWYLDHLCTLYDKEKSDICLALNFMANDFNRTNTLPEEMAAMGINATILRQRLGADFESLFAMNIRFEEFATVFQLTGESLRALNLTKVQKYALAAHRGWTPQAVMKHCKIGFDQLSDLWFTPGMD